MSSKRIIKFRAWDLNKKEMVLFPHKTKDLVFTDFGPSIMYFHNGMQFPLIDNKLHLMQYTGLKDKNGKEIYESDIVLDQTQYFDLYDTEGLYKNNKVIIPLKVYWVEEEARFMLLGDWDNEKRCFSRYSDQLHDRKLEIIGNLYQNPELLVGKTKNA